MVAPDFSTTHWQKSSRTAGGPDNACVEVGNAQNSIGVRDTKLKEKSPVLTFEKSKWVAFLDAIKHGEGDL